MEKEIPIRRAVYVTVSGGVAYSALVPDDVDVHIIDFDDLRADRGYTLSTYTADERAFILSLEEDALR